MLPKMPPWLWSSQCVGDFCFSSGTCYAPRDGPYDCEDLCRFGFFLFQLRHMLCSRRWPPWLWSSQCVGDFRFTPLRTCGIKLAEPSWQALGLPFGGFVFCFCVCVLDQCICFVCAASFVMPGFSRSLLSRTGQSLTIIILNNRRITKAAANKKRNTQAKNTNTKTRHK